MPLGGRMCFPIYAPFRTNDAGCGAARLAEIESHTLDIKAPDFNSLRQGTSKGEVRPASAEGGGPL